MADALAPLGQPVKAPYRGITRWNSGERVNADALNTRVSENAAPQRAANGPRQSRPSIGGLAGIAAVRIVWVVEDQADVNSSPDPAKAQIAFDELGAFLYCWIIGADGLAVEEPFAAILPALNQTTANFKSGGTQVFSTSNPTDIMSAANYGGARRLLEGSGSTWAPMPTPPFCS